MKNLTEPSVWNISAKFYLWRLKLENLSRTESSGEKLRKCLEKVFSEGYQLQAEALSFLKLIEDKVDVEKILDKVFEKLKTQPQPTIFISKGLIEECVNELEEENRRIVEKVRYLEVSKEVYHPPAKDVEAKIEVLKDPSKSISSGESLSDFLSYFRDRFKRLTKILSERLDVKGSLPIEDALKKSGRVKVIGLISEKIVTSRRIVFRIEDLEKTATIIVQPENPEVFQVATELLLDQVVCVSGFRGGGDTIFAEEILLPDIPYHKPRYSWEDVNVVFTSDIHVGSIAFEEKLFRRFLDWLKGRIGEGKSREIAGKVKYVVVAGDVVDGVGQYPRQEDELEIKDVYKQYKVAAKLFEEIPDYIEVIIIPGNHDAVRRTLPQPAILKNFAEPLYDVPNILMLGNPSYIRLHGVELLLHHGRSLEDVLSSLPNVNHQNVTKAMSQLLKVRHLAPVYGHKTPIAPEPIDWMVVDRIPDIYHTGHIHVFDHSTYRGVLLINSGCWQRQTSYQKKMGVTPTYGVTPIVNLKTLNLSIVDFRSF
ncbi:DNA-directed DNA polymerase II small subunit [Candidatus Bathyarchaeota archaeon]|nr:MAG: DNA-directed DNA polymerase II small subunit [Candidatus Bathyarchaeota archaeon]